MRAVGALDGGVPADTEPQSAAVLGAGEVVGLRRVEPLVLRPAPERTRTGGLETAGGALLLGDPQDRACGQERGFVAVGGFDG